MSEKSYVTLEQQKCVVCVKDFDTNNLLMDMRLRNTFDMHTLTGWGLCPECKGKIDAGYVALVGVDPAKTVADDIHHPKPHEVWRTGDIMFLRASAWERMFDVPVPEKRVAWVDPELVQKLKKLAEQ